MNSHTLATRTLYLPLISACLAALAMLPLAAHAANPVNGQRLYLANCAGCHGQNGLSIMPKAPNLARGESLNQPDTVLLGKLRSGVGFMPPFFGILKDSELDDIISYVRSLH
jgi:cytochrome c6